MTDELDPQRKFRLELLANEFSLRPAFIRLMLLDPAFAQDARGWFDTLFGKLSTLGTETALNPQLTSELREEYLGRPALIEKHARVVTAPPDTARPKSIRRRIFEWFERG